MLTNITFSLPEKTVKRLRKRVKESGGKKGSISEVVDEALSTYLDALEESARGETFMAVRGEEVVAQARSLKELAAALLEKKVDWRAVLITSSRPLEPVGHLGLRMRPA
jgi:Arc/MetJ-type ribon-helix-helix transcriptional regulator